MRGRVHVSKRLRSPERGVRLRLCGAPGACPRSSCSAGTKHWVTLFSPHLGGMEGGLWGCGGHAALSHL